MGNFVSDANMKLFVAWVRRKNRPSVIRFGVNPHDEEFEDKPELFKRHREIKAKIEAEWREKRIPVFKRLFD